MLLIELLKFSTQHRTYYCYLILSIWIFLLIAGMYKYMGRNAQYLNNHLSQNFATDKQQRQKLHQEKSMMPSLLPSSSSYSDFESLEKYKTRCTPLANVQHIDDGGILDGWKLQGVLLVIRHGDRGPMSHVRKIPSLNCGQTDGNYLVNMYRSFLYNSTSVSGSNHMYWNKPGSFHGFPLLPLDDKACLLGQLTFNDIINIDQNDGQIENSLSYIRQISTTKKPPPLTSSEQQPMTMGCIQSKQIKTLMDFTTWQSQQIAHHKFYKSIGALRAYGMLRHIVSYMLRMISGDRTKFVLYSGHDWTLQYLTAALGIKSIDNTFIPYAARLAIEVYKSATHIDYYFRLVYNGRDVTRHVDFCEGGKSLRVNRDSRGNKADLCPIENIIRFLHDDYFLDLNVTNFKDACTVL